MTGTRRDGTPATRTRRRDEILDAALALYDEEGIGPVSTNHVAARAGVSPGNLYYWFSGKPAILRALVERWQLESTFPVGLQDDDPVTVLHAVADVLGGQPEVNRRYAPLVRELVPLLRADAELAAVYRAGHEARVAELVRAVDALVAAGLVRAPLPPVTTRDLVVGGWVLAELGPALLEVLSPEDPGADGASRSRTVLAAPLLVQLTDAGRSALGLGPADPAAGVDR